MISMKIDYVGDLIVIYLYKYHLNLDSMEELKQEIKSLFVILMKNYHLSLTGYFKVDLYENKKYGFILEIKKLYNELTFTDLKIIIHYDTKFYLVTDSYYFFNIKESFIKNNKYYYNLDTIDKLDNYIEFGSIYYDK